MEMFVYNSILLYITLRTVNSVSWVSLSFFFTLNVGIIIIYHAVQLLYCLFYINMIPFLAVIGDNYTGCNHELEYSNVRYYFSDTLAVIGTTKETILVIKKIL